MKKTLMILALITILLLPSLVLAAEFKSGNLDKDETISNDLYISNDKLVIDGDVKGDLVAAGSDVIINDKVDNDLMVAGGNVVIKGEIGDDIRVAGGTVIMEGQCYGDLLVAGGTVEILPKAKIHRDLLIWGGTAKIDGTVFGKTYIAGGNVSINGNLSGDVSAKIGNLVIGNDAQIQGKLTYYSGTEAQINSAAKAAQVEYKKIAEKKTTSALSFLNWGFLINILATIILALILVYLMPQKSKKVVELAKQEFWPNLGLGALILILPPLTAFVLMCTIVGFLIALVILLVYAVLLLAAIAYAGVILGSWLLKIINKAKDYRVDWLAVIFGILLIKFIGVIPFLGWLFGMVMMLLALGSLARLDYSFFKEMKKKKLV